MKFTFKIWLLIVVVLLSLIAIFGIPPKFMESGLTVKSLDQNSTAFEQGLRAGQTITSVDGIDVKTVEEFYSIIDSKFPSNDPKKITIDTKEAGQIILFTSEFPEIIVSEITNTNLQFGLDISGGSRALVKAENRSLSQDEINDLVDITSNRLNEFGISDVRVIPISDLGGERFMLIEIAGATPNDLENLIAQQGKFEAKIGEDVIFEGGNRDIASVCRGDATCAGIRTCNVDSTGNHFCRFDFSVYLSPEAAQRHADITDALTINFSSQGSYLSKNLDLYLDDNLVDTLLISSDLKGRATTQIQISGSGNGPTREDAFEDADESMHKLQTLLITGSLPYKLEIVKLDTISPTLGNDFIKTLMIAGLLSILVVSIIIMVRYRNIKSSVALLITSFSEIIIILGVASLIRWNLDLLSIAGILATIGTGIDQQIVILDESKELASGIKERLKRAFAIIIGAYLTVLVAMLPLVWAGAGLLKGFAITTLIGITAGVLITRPAFTDIIKILTDK